MRLVLPLQLLCLACPLKAFADDQYFRGKRYEGRWYDIDDVHPSEGRSGRMEIIFRSDGTYEFSYHAHSLCDEDESVVGEWTAVGDGFVIEDYYREAPLNGRFLGRRAAGLYLAPEGDWAAWALHQAGAKPWYEAYLWGARADGTALEAELSYDGTCSLWEHDRFCRSTGVVCTWSLDPVTGLPLIDTAVRRYTPSPLPEPGCFHYDDGGLGVDVCAY